MVLEYLHGLPDQIGEIILTLLALITIWIGYLLGKLRSSFKNKKNEKKHLNIQNDLHSAWESKKNEIENENSELKGTVQSLEKRLEDYRLKISGMGIFNHNKKQGDILYSLLLENEMLEQLILKHHEESTNQRINHYEERLRDITKRQRLIAELFNDEKIKDYVKDTIKKEISGGGKKEIASD